MSALWSPYAFDVGGQPYALSAPPALRAIGGQITAVQAAMAQDAFARFCNAQRYSLVPNPSEIGRLPDGTAYRIDVVGVQAIMQVWPQQGTSPSGNSGIVVFYEGLGHYLVRYKGSAWAAQPVRSGYFGAGVHAALAGGGYVLSPRDISNLDVSSPQPTKFNQLLRTQDKSPRQPLVLTGDGYVCEAGPAAFQTDWALIPHTKTKVTFILFGSDEYDRRPFIYHVDNAPAPSESPSKLLAPVHIGNAAPAPSPPRWARQYGTTCIYSTGGGDVFGVNTAARRGFALSAQALCPNLPNQPVASAVRRALAAVAPYGQTAAPHPSTYTQETVTSSESRRWANELRIVNQATMTTRVEVPNPPGQFNEYFGYPATGELITQYESEGVDKSTHSNAEYASGSYWLDDLVDADGELYSAQATFEVDLGLKRELVTKTYAAFSTAYEGREWRFELPDGIVTFPVSGVNGQWQNARAEWGSWQERSTRYRNRIMLGFGAEAWQLKTLEVDLWLDETWTLGTRPSYLPTLPGEDTRQFVLGGTCTVRAVVAYEEKTCTSVVAEVVLESLSAKLPYGNSTFVDCTAVGKRHLAIYRKGQRVFTVARDSINISQTFSIYGRLDWGNAPLGAADLQPLGLSLGEMALVSDVGPAANPQGRKYLAAAYPPLDQSLSWLRYQENVTTGDQAVTGLFFDYEKLCSDLRTPYPNGARFALDPLSGGLGVFVHDAGCHVLLAPGDGAATELSQVTGLNNSTLHKIVRAM